MSSEASRSSFVRYFLICGLDSNAGLETDENIAGDSFTRGPDSNPLEKSYKPKILRHFPDITSWSHFNPDAISRLILPQGLRFCTDKEISTLPPKCHPFLMTKEDGEKSVGVSMVFYEEVQDINICHAIHTLQKMYTTESEGSRENVLTIHRAADRERPRSARVPSERSRSLPRHYQQNKLSSSTLDLSGASYDYRRDTLYATKSIAVILSDTLVTMASQVLVAMQKYINKSDFDVQVLEGLIFNLLHDIPLPSPGKSVRFWCLGDAVTLSMPKVPKELPLFDYNLLEFFDILGVSNAIKLFICILLEHQILVYSSDFEKLMVVCESVTALLYPFSWPHVYVPILPPALETFLDAPVPYIMGLLRRTHDIELYKRGTVAIVDIDNGELDLPDIMPEFPYESDFIQEIESCILKYGGSEGLNILKEHAKEANLESSFNQNFETPEKMRLHDPASENSDTMDQLNKMIQKFEQLSASKSTTPISSAGTNRPNPNSVEVNPYVERQRLNNAIREVCVNRFSHMFLSFEHFVIINNEEEDRHSPQFQDTQQNFDKISFLSDQVRSHLPFLSAFLETQMFSTFIDEAILKMNEPAPIETPFEFRLRTLKERFGESLVRTPTYEPTAMIEITDKILTGRLKKADVMVTPPKIIRTASSTSRASSQASPVGIFPLLDPSRFVANFRTDNHIRKSPMLIRGDRNSQSIDVSLVTPQKITMMNPSPASIAETNWKFVNQLLRECKQKTKRILVEKLGQEAVEWGHGEIGFSSSEENMLVAIICDLIERIWSHGLQNQQRKSALWFYLYRFGRSNEKSLRFKGTMGCQAYCVPLVDTKPYILPDHSRPIQVIVDPGIQSETFDSSIMNLMHNVGTMHEIKTEIGYARAWIRLALERKMLSHFLHVLLNDSLLLKQLYKRYAFLRCEDEREQALYYLQTLNTVDFSCFTNAYIKSSILYQVLIFPSQKASPMSSANIWLHVVGSHAETDVLHVPRGVLHFSFWSLNLGILTSLRLGFYNASGNSSLLVEHILIQNEFTGQNYKFTCGRWLGQNIDDGSTERYMVGYPMSLDDASTQDMVLECMNQPLTTCPVTQLKSTLGSRDQDQEEVAELQTMLGDAINRIVKFYHKSLNEKISYAHLMCGQFGLVHALLYIFSYGYKSARLFGKNLFVWDFFLKVTMDFNQALQHQWPSTSAENSPHASPKRGHNTLESPKRPGGGKGGLGSSMSNLLDSPRRSIPSGNNLPQPQPTLSRANQFRRMYTRLITRIETTCYRLGKDDKFQLFVCLSAHDRLLGRIVTDLTKAVAAQQLYEEHAFLRNPSLITSLSHVLKSIDDISVPVDPALKTTLEQHSF